jgi:hypothetical protein
MENNDNIIMSRIAFERMQSKDERNDHWRNVIILTLIILLVVTNAMWLVAWNQYDYVDTDDSYSIEAQQDGEGINIVGGGDIDYGANSIDNNSQANEIEDTQ